MIVDCVRIHTDLTIDSRGFVYIYIILMKSQDLALMAADDRIREILNIEVECTHPAGTAFLGLKLLRQKFEIYLCNLQSETIQLPCRPTRKLQRRIKWIIYNS